MRIIIRIFVRCYRTYHYHYYYCPLIIVVVIMQCERALCRRRRRRHNLRRRRTDGGGRRTTVLSRLFVCLFITISLGRVLILVPCFLCAVPCCAVLFCFVVSSNKKERKNCCAPTKWMSNNKIIIDRLLFKYSETTT